jgi:hypothetical protein
MTPDDKNAALADIEKLAAAMGVKMVAADLPGPNSSLADLRARGWRYIDSAAWFSPEMWDRLLGVLGDGEYKILAMTKHPTRGIRGQFFVSPKAVENMEKVRTKDART